MGWLSFLKGDKSRSEGDSLRHVLFNRVDRGQRAAGMSRGASGVQGG